MLQPTEPAFTAQDVLDEFGPWIDAWPPCPARTWILGGHMPTLAEAEQVTVEFHLGVDRLVGLLHEMFTPA